MAQFALPQTQYHGLTYHKHRRYMQFPTDSMKWAIEREFKFRGLYSRGGSRVVLTWGWHEGGKPGVEDYKTDPLEHCTFQVFARDWRIFIGTYHGYPENVFPANNFGRSRSRANHYTNPGLSQVVGSIHNGHSRVTEQSLYRQSLANAMRRSTLQNVPEEEHNDGSDEIFHQLRSSQSPAYGAGKNQLGSYEARQSNPSVSLQTHRDSGSAGGRQRARIARPGSQNPLEKDGVGAKKLTYTVIAENFSPGTSVEDIRAVLLTSLPDSIKNDLVSCRLIDSNPRLVAELAFSKFSTATFIVARFNNIEADGRVLHVYHESTNPEVGTRRGQAGSSTTSQKPSKNGRVFSAREAVKVDEGKNMRTSVNAFEHLGEE
ncbi:hypothetical protein FKW77_009806 [Venturia effusa]|uniref:RRM domain-containing protein n=1 Tax=Venturia effusa TaxID=50376 RepID=A0A517LA10_9PEZI|nr:hypothetical protein FKW77_009806 [Venturia effusa]